MRALMLVAVAGSLLIAGCRSSEAPDAATGGGPIAGASSAGASGASVPAPPTGDAFADFVAVNRVDGVLDAWLAEMHRQWDHQAQGMRVKPPEGFWEKTIATFDLDSERRLLLDAVRAEMTEEEMRADVAWLRASGMVTLTPQLEAIGLAAAPHQSRLAQAASRAAQRASGSQPAGELPPAPPIPRVELSSEDLARVRTFMESVGYGAPEVLAARLVDAVRQAAPDAPEATWTDPEVLAAARDAAAGIEAAFATTWTPDEAVRLAAAVGSPEGRKHDELMERVTLIAMTRSEPFGKAVQKHVIEAYAPIFDAAWKEEQERRAREGGATAPAP